MYVVPPNVLEPIVVPSNILEPMYVVPPNVLEPIVVPSNILESIWSHLQYNKPIIPTPKCNFNPVEKL